MTKAQEELRAKQEIVKAILGYIPTPDGKKPPPEKKKMDMSEWPTEDESLVYVLDTNEQGQQEFILNYEDNAGEEQEIVLAWDLAGIDELIGILTKVKAAAVAAKMPQKAPDEPDEEGDDDEEEGEEGEDVEEDEAAP